MEFEDTSRLSIYPKLLLFFLVNAIVRIARAARLIVVAGNQCLEEDMLSATYIATFLQNCEAGYLWPG